MNKTNKFTRLKNRMISITLVMVMIVLSMPTTALAASIDVEQPNWFTPAASVTTPASAKSFKDHVKTSGSDANYALIPPSSKKDYYYPVSGRGKGSLLKGSAASKGGPTVTLLENKVEGFDYEDDVWIFSLESPNNKEVKIQYTGQSIYNPSTQLYEPVDIVLEILAYSKVEQWKGVPAVINIRKNIAKNKFLPSIHMRNIGTIKIKYTFLDTNTQKKKSIKSNITWGDIDAGQAVSVWNNDIAGHMAASDSVLKAGTYRDGDWYSFTAPEVVVSNTDKTANQYKGGHYISGSDYTVRFTSHQSAKNNYHPLGTASHFTPSSYGTPPPGDVEMPPAYKYVKDNDRTDDVDTNKATSSHNKLAELNNEFTYYIAASLPPRMSPGLSGQDLNYWRFYDTIDSCLEVKSVDVLKRERSAAADELRINDPTNEKGYESVKSRFTIETPVYDDGSTHLRVKLKRSDATNDQMRDLYGDGVGSLFLIKVTVKVKDGLTLNDVGSHVIDGVGAHLSNNHIDIPNTATVQYELKGKDSQHEDITNGKDDGLYVYTRASDGPKTLRIVKVDKGTNAQIKQAGIEFTITKKRSDGTTEAVLNDSEEEIFATDSNGVVTVDLVPGTYNITEVTPPAGYGTTSTVTKTFTTSDSSPVTVTVADEKTQTKFLKVNDNDEPIAGAVLGLFQSDGSTYVKINSNNEVVTSDGSNATWTTSDDADEAKVIKGLDFNQTYILKEISAPAGYDVASPISFEPNEAVTTKVVKMTDHEKTQFTLKKVDDANHIITGVKFILKDGNNNVVQEGTVDSNAEVSFGGLSAGTYTLYEANQPDWVEPISSSGNASDIYTVTIASNNAVTIKKGTTTISPVSITGGVGK